MERLVITELKRLLARVAEISDVQVQWSPDAFVRRMKRIESASEMLARVVSTGVFWDGGQYASLWADVVKRLVAELKGKKLPAPPVPAKPPVDIGVPDNPDWFKK